MKIEVDAKDLQTLLQGLISPGPSVREWQATYRFDKERGSDHNPIVNLVNQYVDWYEEQKASDNEIH